MAIFYFRASPEFHLAISYYIALVFFNLQSFFVFHDLDIFEKQKPVILYVSLNLNLPDVFS